MKKNLLVVVGAGASLHFDMPSVHSIGSLFEKWALELFPLKDDETKSLYTFIHDNIETRALTNTGINMSKLLSFENLLFAIQQLSSLHIDLDNHFASNRMMPFLDLKALPEIIHKEVHPNFFYKSQASANDLARLQARLIHRLVEHFRTQCILSERTKTIELDELKEFFNALSVEFNIGVISLNYDNIIHRALPDFHTGFDPLTGKFDRQSVFSNTGRFCYHMHGSVHYDFSKGGNDPHTIIWQNDLNAVSNDDPQYQSYMPTNEGLYHFYSTIVAGLDKTAQLMKEPFGILYSQLDRLVYNADSLLFLGYGFNDQHLNKSFSFINGDQIHKRRSVVVIDYKEYGHPRFRHADHGFGEMHNCFSRHYKAFDHSSVETIDNCRHTDSLDAFSELPLPYHIWYNGMSEATKFPDKIIAALR